MIKTKELKFYKLCDSEESPGDSMHRSDKAVFGTDIRLKQFDTTISSFPMHHVETWLWSPGIEPFAHCSCNWEYEGWWIFKRLKSDQRLGNNSGAIPDLVIKKGQPLYFGVWYHNMRNCKSDFHAKCTIYYEELP